MAINVVYGPDGQLLTEAAFQSGAGQYQQSQDRLALEEARLAQQGSQFQQELGLREQQLALQDMLNRRGLGAQMYQFNAQRQDQAAAKEMDIASRFQQELLRQQGFEDMRQSQQDLQTQEIEADREKFLTQEQRRIQEFHLNKLHNTGMASAADIVANKKFMTPEQWDQAVGQWEQQYGDAIGAFPFTGNRQNQAGPGDDVVGGILNGLQSIDPELFTEEDAIGIAELPRTEQVQAKMKLFELKAAQAKAKEEAEIARWVKEQDYQFKAQQEAEDLQYNMVKNAEKIAQDKMKAESDRQIAREKAILEQEIKLRMPIEIDPETKKPVYLPEEDIEKILGRIRGTGGVQPTGNVTQDLATARRILEGQQSESIPEWTGSPVTFTYRGRTMERFGPGPRDVRVIQ